MSVERIHKKQTEWQKKRKTLPWAKKVRMLEAVRDSIEEMSRHRKRASH